ncbi:hypothetical protein YC2023_072062 [Brassica napus]
MGGRRFVTPRQTCPRPEGLGCNLRSKTRWFTGFCNSHQVSHFATFFIDARAEISVAESRFRLYIAALLPNKHRLWVGESRLFSCIFLDTFRTVRNRPTESDVSSFSGRSVSRMANHPRRRDPNTSPDHSIGRSDGRGVLKATSADPWSASFMVETRTLFVFHKSKNFTSDYEIRMPPTACFEHSNFFKVTAPEARPGQLRPGAYRRQKRQADRCSPKADRATHPKNVRGRPSAVAVCGLSVQYTQDVRQHTQDLHGCPCVPVCPSVHTGRPSAHTGRPSAHAGRPSAHAGCPSAHAGRPSAHAGRLSAHAGRPCVSVCVRVSVSTHRTSVSTHRTSVSTQRTSMAVRQYTQDVRGRPSAHTGRPSVHRGRPWPSVSTHRTSVPVRVCPCVCQYTQDVLQYTQDVLQHTQDVRGLSVFVRVSVSTHRTSFRTHRTSVAVRQYTQDVRGRPSYTQDVRQHTQDVRACPFAHTDCPWTAHQYIYQHADHTYQHAGPSHGLTVY